MSITVAATFRLPSLHDARSVNYTDEPA